MGIMGARTYTLVIQTFRRVASHPVVRFERVTLYRYKCRIEARGGVTKTRLTRVFPLPVQRACVRAARSITRVVRTRLKELSPNKNAKRSVA